MGGYVGMIGNYSLHMSDWVFDYVKDRQPKKYYEKYMVDLTFITRNSDHHWSDSNKEEEFQVSILKLGTIKKLKTHYRFEPDFSLQKLIWEQIKKRGLIIEGYIGIDNRYYLTSEIGEIPIKLQSPTEGVDILHHINNYDENVWLVKQGFEFYSKLRTKK